MFVYELGANTCWYSVCLMIIVVETLCLYINCLRMFVFMIIYARYY